MPEEIFQFKQFAIRHSNSALKVNTDSVLLGAWTNFKSAEKILDIGAGNGILSLMSAQKCQAEITAIEPDKNSFSDLIYNVSNSPWAERIGALQLTLQDFTETNHEKFDCFICNPPYFEDSLKNPDASKSLARHNDELSMVDLLQCITQIARNPSEISLIFPFATHEKLLSVSKKHGWHPARLTSVCGTANDAPNRMLIHLGTSASQTDESNIIIRGSGAKGYSHEYLELCRDFYTFL
jgi:tRNA1Val (adenine37-N6)-methyltransferase